MKLNLSELKNRKWGELGIKLPSFDIAEMKKRTAETPEWVHFGAGNIFRGFVAANHQELLEAGKANTGIIAVETFDYEIIDRIYKPHDNLTLNVCAASDGSLKKEITASIAEGLTGDAGREPDKKRLIEIFRHPSLKMVSFTITEKGYTITDSRGQILGFVEEDLKNGPTSAKHVMCILVALMYERFKAGAYPLALVSMDNCSHNGEKLQKTIFRIAEEWKKQRFVEKEFIDYLKDESKVTCPWSMIDRITPRPSADIQTNLEDVGIEEITPVITGKNTFIAPYVNSEETKYLFIEDAFPNGKIPLDETEGIWFTDRNTVNNVETMKVTTCLNPLHTAIAVTGALLNYDLVSEAVKDREIDLLIKRIGYEEGLPVVNDPGIISPRDFLDQVYFKRFRNPYIPDSPQRIATDTSMKVGIRFGETIKAYFNQSDKKTSDLKGIALALAAWFRYLLGVDDKGAAMEISPDPHLEELRLKLNTEDPFGKVADIRRILENSEIFGMNLMEAGLGDLIQQYFTQMCSGPGALKQTLRKYL